MYMSFITRLIFPLLLYFINFARLDRTTNSHSKGGDYKIYVAMLLADHRHNNPVLNVFIDTTKRFLRILRSDDMSQENRVAIDRNAYHASPSNTDEQEARVAMAERKSPNTMRLVKMMAVMYTIHRNDRLREKRNRNFK